MKTRSIEVKRARHTYSDHDHVHCAVCDDLISGPHQRTAQLRGRGMWARECLKCLVITWYDVEEDFK